MSYGYVFDSQDSPIASQLSGEPHPATPPTRDVHRCDEVNSLLAAAGVDAVAVPTPSIDRFWNHPARYAARTGSPADDDHLLKEDPVILSCVRSFNRLVRPRLDEQLKTGDDLLKHRKAAYKMGRRLWGLSGRGKLAIHVSRVNHNLAYNDRSSLLALEPHARNIARGHADMSLKRQRELGVVDDGEPVANPGEGVVDSVVAQVMQGVQANHVALREEYERNERAAARVAVVEKCSDKHAAEAGHQPCFCLHGHLAALERFASDRSNLPGSALKLVNMNSATRHMLHKRCGIIKRERRPLLDAGHTSQDKTVLLVVIHGVEDWVSELWLSVYLPAVEADAARVEQEATAAAAAATAATAVTEEEAAFEASLFASEEAREAVEAAANEQSTLASATASARWSGRADDPVDVEAQWRAQQAEEDERILAGLGYCDDR